MLQASGVDGAAAALLETDEWRYSTGVCHIALRGLKVDLGGSAGEGGPETATSPNASVTSQPAAESITVRVSVTQRYSMCTRMRWGGGR